MYNLEEATKSLITTGAFLVKDLHYDPERVPNVNKVEDWHEGAMILLHLCQAAHKEIKRLKGDNRQAMELMADVEYGLDEWNYPIGTKQNVEKMCDDFFGKGIRPE